MSIDITTAFPITFNVSAVEMCHLMATLYSFKDTNPFVASVYDKLHTVLDKRIVLDNNTDLSTLVFQFAMDGN